jgi:Ion transport protein
LTVIIFLIKYVVSKQMLPEEIEDFEEAHRSHYQSMDHS